MTEFGSGMIEAARRNPGATLGSVSGVGLIVVALQWGVPFLRDALGVSALSVEVRAQQREIEAKQREIDWLRDWVRATAGDVKYYHGRATATEPPKPEEEKP